MRDLDDDLDLRTLGAETGYSQRHFIRISRRTHIAFASTPLAHAKKLLRQDRAELIDVAAASGFSSHEHMIQGFRHLLGNTQ